MLGLFALQIPIQASCSVPVLGIKQAIVGLESFIFLRACRALVFLDLCTRLLVQFLCLGRANPGFLFFFVQIPCLGWNWG